MYRQNPAAAGTWQAHLSGTSTVGCKRCQRSLYRAHSTASHRIWRAAESGSEQGREEGWAGALRRTGGDWKCGERSEV